MENYKKSNPQYILFFSRLALFVGVLLVISFVTLQAKDYGGIEQQRISKVFAGNVDISAPVDEFKVRVVKSEGKSKVTYSKAKMS